MPSYAIQQSSAAQPLLFLLVSSSDHISPATGLTPTVTLSKNGGAFASPAGAVSEVGSGVYKVAANGTDSNTLGPLWLHATATGADPTDVVFPVVAFNPQSATNLGLSALPTAAPAASGGLPIVGSAPLTNLDAAVSSRSTYAGADTAGTTTLLSRLTAQRATNLDNLDAAVSSRSTYAGADTAGTTTLVGLLTPTRAGNLDNLDAAVSTRLAASSYAAPPTAAAIAAAVLTDTTSADLATAGSLGHLVTTAPGWYAAPLALSSALSAPRALDAVADGSITLNDALWAAVCGAAGKESVSGTTYTVKTPSTGTVLRTFTLDSGTSPTQRS
jgi:hypothetical protein